MKTKLSYPDYLQALAMFTVAQQHYSKMREMELGLIQFLEFEDESYGECISDAIYNETSFDKALKKQSIIVEPKASAKAA